MSTPSTRLVGTLLLVAGFGFGIYFLQSDVIPVVNEALKTETDPELGFGVIKVVIPGFIALFGLWLIKDG